MSIQGISNNNTSYADPVGGSEMGKEAFMELLVQQLKNQDPMSPMDNDKFIAQLTQLSELEGIQNLNDNMVGLAVLQQGNALMSQLTQSSSLIGKDVTYFNPDTGEENTGTVQSVKIEEGIAILNIDGVDVPLGNVLEITEGSDSGDAGEDESGGDDTTDDGSEG
jgi:flagellar basal-body rod modification protein FlgD